MPEYVTLQMFAFLLIFFSVHVHICSEKSAKKSAKKSSEMDGM